MKPLRTPDLILWNLRKLIANPSIDGDKTHHGTRNQQTYEFSPSKKTRRNPEELPPLTKKKPQYPTPNHGPTILSSRTTQNGQFLWDPRQ